MADHTISMVEFEKHCRGVLADLYDHIRLEFGDRAYLVDGRFVYLNFGGEKYQVTLVYTLEDDPDILPEPEDDRPDWRIDAILEELMCRRPTPSVTGAGTKREKYHATVSASGHTAVFHVGKLSKLPEISRDLPWRYGS